jgi:hypothetical protein
MSNGQADTPAIAPNDLLRATDPAAPLFFAPTTPLADFGTDIHDKLT